MDNYNNIVNDYNNILSNLDNKIMFNDVITDKYDVVHKQLYKTALNKLLKELAEENDVDVDEFIKEYYKTHKIVEIKNSNYFEPSEIISYNKTFPYKMHKYSLAKYWDNYEYELSTKDINDLDLDEDTKKYAELVYIDYVNSRCKFKSKLNGEEFWVPANYITTNIKYSENFKIDNIFSSMLNTEIN